MEPVNEIPDPKNHLALAVIAESLSNLQKAIIGISGAGGAGKTTFARNIVKYFGHEQALTIDLDDYLLSREERGKLGVTGYNPLANNLTLACQHIGMLREGMNIEKPSYNHATGKKGLVIHIEPKPLIVIEGVTTLYQQLIGLYNVSIFLDALEETQIQSRIKRDVNKRGYSLDEALALFATIRPDYHKFIEPTIVHADRIFLVGIDYIMKMEGQE